LRLPTAPEGDWASEEVAALAAQLRDDFGAALADDLNTSGALGALFKFVKGVNVTIDEGRLGSGDRQRVTAALADVDRVLGVLDAAEWQREAAGGPSDADVERLIEERQAARKARNFARADEIRNQLLEQGVVLEDTAGATRWKRSR
jgi:cysteinyl-tRNA synthetase